MDDKHVIVEKLRVAADARGIVFEPLDALGLQAQRNVHIVVTAPGAIRGNHYHHEGWEVSAVAGPARVRYREADQLTTLDVPVGEVWRFNFPAGVVHAFQNTGEGPMVIASFNTVPHDPANAGTEREVIL